MDLTFQVPRQYCYLHHQTLLPLPVTSTPGCCFCFGAASSFFLELFLHSSPVAYWAPTHLGSSSFSVLSFCLFVLFNGVLKARILSWFAIPFSSGPHLSELSTMTRPSWVVLHGMAHSFTGLDKAEVHVIRSVVSRDYGLHSVCPLMEKDKKLTDPLTQEILLIQLLFSL